MWKNQTHCRVEMIQVFQMYLYVKIRIFDLSKEEKLWKLRACSSHPSSPTYSRLQWFRHLYNRHPCYTGKKPSSLTYCTFLFYGRRGILSMLNSLASSSHWVLLSGDQLHAMTFWECSCEQGIPTNANPGIVLIVYTGAAWVLTLPRSTLHGTLAALWDTWCHCHFSPLPP